MNAKKAKQIRRMARMLAEQTERQDPSVYNQEPQVVDKNGAVVNTIASVRGVYQYLKNPKKFSKRYKES